MSSTGEMLAEISALAAGPGNPEERLGKSRLQTIDMLAQAAAQALDRERAVARADAVEYAAWLCNGCVQCTRDLRAMAAQLRNSVPGNG